MPPGVRLFAIPHAAAPQAAGLEAQLAEAAAEQERLRQLCAQLEAQVGVGRHVAGPGC